MLFLTKVYLVQVMPCAICLLLGGVHACSAWHTTHKQRRANGSCFSRPVIYHLNKSRYGYTAFKYTLFQTIIHSSLSFRDSEMVLCFPESARQDLSNAPGPRSLRSKVRSVAAAEERQAGLNLGKFQTFDFATSLLGRLSRFHRFFKAGSFSHHPRNRWI